MEKVAASRRRWFQFSLTTMFVVVTGAAALLGYNTYWIRQRHAYLTNHPEAIHDVPQYEQPVRAPGLLWLFGERGKSYIAVQAPGFMKDRDFHKLHAGPEAEEARRLFPEAILEVEDGELLINTWKPGKPWTWGSSKKKSDSP
jgi:hypothetical protein